MRSLQIFTVCTLGAFIGSLIALELSSSFWWVGALVGFLGGYLAYDPVSTARGAVATWEFTTEAAPEMFVGLGRWLTSAVTLASWLVAFLLIPSNKGLATDMVTVAAMSVSIGLFLAVMLTTVEDGVFQYKHGWDRNWIILVLASPVVIFYWLPRGLWWVVGNCRRISAAIWGAVRFFFRTIHSEIRLLCGFDAALGTCIGYFCGNAVVGAVAGGLLGLLNYEIVSKRWLKLIPTN